MQPRAGFGFGGFGGGGFGGNGNTFFTRPGDQFPTANPGPFPTSFPQSNHPTAAGNTSPTTHFTPPVPISIQTSIVVTTSVITSVSHFTSPAAAGNSQPAPTANATGTHETSGTVPDKLPDHTAIPKNSNLNTSTSQSENETKLSLTPQASAFEASTLSSDNALPTGTALSPTTVATAAISPPKHHHAAVIGAVLSVVVVLLLIGIVLLILRRRRAQKNAHQRATLIPNPPELPPVQPPPTKWELEFGHPRPEYTEPEYTEPEYTEPEPLNYPIPSTARTSLVSPISTSSLSLSYYPLIMPRPMTMGASRASSSGPVSSPPMSPLSPISPDAERAARLSQEVFALRARIRQIEGLPPQPMSPHRPISSASTDAPPPEYNSEGIRV